MTMTQEMNTVSMPPNNKIEEIVELKEGEPAEQTLTSEQGEPATTSPTRKRKTKAERLQIALAKQAELETKIAGLKKDLDDTARKTRNRGLLLVGIVVEQCFKKNVFNEENNKWWLRQAKRLPDKDRDAYVEFLETLKE